MVKSTHSVITDTSLGDSYNLSLPFNPSFTSKSDYVKTLRSSSVLRHVNQINTDDKLLMNVTSHQLWSRPPATLKASVYIMPFNIYLHPFKINKYFELAGDEVFFALYGSFQSEPLIPTGDERGIFKGNEIEAF